MSRVKLFLGMILVQLLLLCPGAFAVSAEQQILQDDTLSSKSILAVRAELRKAEIIPTVIDDFLPSLTLNVTWPSNETADLGNTVKPDELQKIPSVKLDDEPTSTAINNPCKSNMTYTIALTDPDAPSRDNPEWSEICHWIVTGVPISASCSTGGGELAAVHSATQTAAAGIKGIMEYKPPGPPPKTGKHRYVFLAFAPANSTSQPLDLTKPEDRQHWARESRGMASGIGRRKMALFLSVRSSYSCSVQLWQGIPTDDVEAANFIYSQNEEQ